MTSKWVLSPGLAGAIPVKDYANPVFRLLLVIGLCRWGVCAPSLSKEEAARHVGRKLIVIRSQPDRVRQPGQADRPSRLC